MVLINKAINEVTVKLVYYGPGLCGKTTNLEKIYGNPKLENKGKMISMSTETDRTLFFDFMPMELGTIGGQKVRVQLYTVPGQVFYDATRKLVLRGTDGVVFVADSQKSMRESNLDSLENLKTNLRLNRIDPEKIALVLQYNKRDLPTAATVEEMNAYMNPGNAPIVEAAAIQGTGVTATLRAAVARILDNLKNNVDTTLHEEPALAAPDMSARSGVTSSSAGVPKLSMRTGAGQAPAPAARRAEPEPVAPTEVDDFPFAMPDFSSMVEPEESSALEVEPVETSSDLSFTSEAVRAPKAGFELPSDVDSPFGTPVESVESVEDGVAGDPFGSVEVGEQAWQEESEDPFASGAVVHDSSSEREGIMALLDGTRQIVQSLETALGQARQNERLLMEKLSAL